MEKLISQIQTLFPQLRFAAGKSFSWSPETNQIFYNAERSGQKANWSLLHETGHALLDHRSYQADFELIQLEVAAWQKAKDIATKLGVKIDEDHIQDCLDTYRDWLYKRSICPACSTKSLQQDDYSSYRCHNCHTVWRVTPSRFCRAYRRSKDVTQATAVFHLQGN